MKAGLLFFLVTYSMLALAQYRTNPSDSNGGLMRDWGRGDIPPEPPKTKRPIGEKEMKTAAWRMLQESGQSNGQLRVLYEVSGVKDFSEFVSAALVAKNLNLNIRDIMYGTRYTSLKNVLLNRGIPPEQVSSEIKKAEVEARKMIKEAS